MITTGEAVAGGGADIAVEAMDMMKIMDIIITIIITTSIPRLLLGGGEDFVVKIIGKIPP